MPRILWLLKSQESTEKYDQLPDHREKDSKYSSPTQNAAHASSKWKPCYLGYITETDIYQQGKKGKLFRGKDCLELIRQAGHDRDNSRA